MVEGLAYTVGVGEGEENVVAAVVVYSRGEVETPESRVLPMTPELTARHGQQQVDRGGEWGERRSRREWSGGHAKQTTKGWVSRGGRCLG